MFGEANLSLGVITTDHTYTQQSLSWLVQTNLKYLAIVTETDCIRNILELQYTVYLTINLFKASL